jgi:hypothetical protein
VRNKETTNDPTMQNIEIYVLMTWGGSVCVSEDVAGGVTEGMTEGTARKLTSTASITVD